MRHNTILLWGLLLVLVVGFRADEPGYKAEIEQWHKARIASLKSESGWLNLAGLFWLNEGNNTVGSDTDNDLVFPPGKAPARLGTIRLTDGTVAFEGVAGADIRADGQPVSPAQTLFRPDQTKPVTLSYGSLRWFVIKRGNRYAIRLRDLESPFLQAFKGIDRFPTDETYRVQARLEAPTAPTRRTAPTIPILDVTGQTSQQPLVGTLVFELAGKTHRLDAVAEGEKLFILFADETNAHDTYGSGRFLYANRPPGRDGLVTLDFNQSINPPCAFTPFATCPLPPKQNRLAVAIKAGEKRFGDH
ncbi:MAG: DUF1684 domain-containing protein [Cytophagales bacterium]|nr:MAG: DUF1684 domain-containing protein [Cytophagales bacterium]